MDIVFFEVGGVVGEDESVGLERMDVPGLVRYAIQNTITPPEN